MLIGDAMTHAHSEPKPTLRQPSVVIIGAGMTGILMAIRCKQAGIKDVIVLEKTHKVGGTWRENTYPGVACDVPAHMYTYSFEPNPNWSNFFAKGPEIQKYFITLFVNISNLMKEGVKEIIRHLLIFQVRFGLNKAI